jgi:hypothetical protein
VSQTCFDWQARCFVTFQLLILSFPNEKKIKNWGFWPRASIRQLFGYPRRFPKGHSMFRSGAIYIYIKICVRMYLYTLPEMMYINSDGPKLRMTKNTAHVEQNLTENAPLWFNLEIPSIPM